MNDKDHQQKARELIGSMAIGIVVSAVTLVPFYLEGRVELPDAVSIIIGSVGLFAAPGLILSMIVSGNVHDFKIPLAGLFNIVLYAILCYLMIRRRRRKQFKSE